MGIDAKEILEQLREAYKKAPLDHESKRLVDAAVPAMVEALERICRYHDVMLPVLDENDPAEFAVKASLGIIDGIITVALAPLQKT